MTARTLTCRELIDFLGAYLDEELAAEERAAFERHLAVCPDCVNYLASYRQAVRLGRSLAEGEAEIPEDVPEELIDAILAARTRN